MFSGLPVQPTEETPEQKEMSVGNEPQPKTKKESPARLASELIKVCAHLTQLQIQAHLVHLNFEGGNFHGIHRFTRKQYRQHQEQFDRVGELIRSLDFLLPMCSKGLLGTCKGFKHIESYDAKGMLVPYITNLEALGTMLKKVIKLSQKEDAPDVENYLAQLVEEMFIASWQVKATLRNM